jgi:hypothetical protein
VIHHIVSYSFPPTVGRNTIEKVAGMFSAMSAIPSVLAVNVGVDAGPPGPGCDTYSAIVTITDAAGYAGYLSHPLHIETLTFAKPLFASTAIRDVCPDRETAASVHALTRRPSSAGPAVNHENDENNKNPRPQENSADAC